MNQAEYDSVVANMRLTVSSVVERSTGRDRQ